MWLCCVLCGCSIRESGGSWPVWWDGTVQSHWKGETRVCVRMSTSRSQLFLVIVCSLDIYNNCCSSKTSFTKAAVWHSSTETALEPSGNTSLIALFIWMNKQWATYPWKKGKPLHKTHFVQYQASSPGLGWLGDGDCYLMHKVQSDSWLYPIETLQGSFSL